MGFPDSWCRVARVYEKYALFSNAVVPACIQWICQRIGKNNFELRQKEWQQLTLFS